MEKTLRNGIDCLPRNVITSYSIHYTKLYEIVILQFLSVYICARIKLCNMFHCDFFQGSDADYIYYFTGWDVGHTDFMAVEPGTRGVTNYF